MMYKIYPPLNVLLMTGDHLAFVSNGPKFQNRGDVPRESGVSRFDADGGSNWAVLDSRRCASRSLEPMVDRVE